MCSLLVIIWGLPTLCGSVISWYRRVTSVPWLLHFLSRGVIAAQRYVSSERCNICTEFNTVAKIRLGTIRLHTQLQCFFLGWELGRVRLSCFQARDPIQYPDCRPRAARFGRSASLRCTWEPVASEPRHPRPPPTPRLWRPPICSPHLCTFLNFYTAFVLSA